MGQLHSIDTPTGDQAHNLWCIGQCSNQLSHPDRATPIVLQDMCTNISSNMIPGMFNPFGGLFQCNKWVSYIQSALTGKIIFFFNCCSITIYWNRVQPRGGPQIGICNGIQNSRCPGNIRKIYVGCPHPHKPELGEGTYGARPFRVILYGNSFAANSWRDHLTCL